MRVAVICGWAASSRRAVAKYAPLYETKGFRTIVQHAHLPAIWLPFLGRRAASQITHELDQLSRQEEDSQRRELDVVLHLFSSASTTFLPGLVSSLSEPNVRWRLRAMVHDSGPVQFGERAGRAASELLYRQGVFGKKQKEVLLAVGRTLNHFVGDHQRSTFTRIWSSPLTAVPQLFLYSRQDSVTKAEEVELRIAEQKQRGVEVMAHCWSEGEHVRHYLEHPEEYERLLGDFLEKYVD